MSRQGKGAIRWLGVSGKGVRWRIWVEVEVEVEVEVVRCALLKKTRSFGFGVGGGGRGSCRNSAAKKRGCGRQMETTRKGEKVKDAHVGQ